MPLNCQLVELPVPRTWGTDGLRALAREACRRRASKRIEAYSPTGGSMSRASHVWR